MKDIPTQRLRPERMAHDVDISAGYMHSGYPVMTFLDVVDSTLVFPMTGPGHWGHFHEFGHNHQVEAGLE